MKKGAITLLLIIITSLVLFVLTIIQFDKIFELLLPKIENVSLISNSLHSSFSIGLLFSIVVALAPILVYITWRVSPISTIKNKMLSSFLIVLFMMLSIIIRQQTIKMNSQLSNPNDGNPQIVYPIEKAHFEYFLFGGLVIGCVLSYITLRDK